MKPFYDEIREFLLLFQVFALCPFGRTNIQSAILKLYSLLSTCLILTGFTLSLLMYNIDEDSSMSEIVEFLVLFGQLSTHGVIIIQSYATRSKQIAILDRLGEIDTIFRMKFGKTIDYAALRRKYRIKFWLLISVMLIMYTNFYIQIFYVPGAASYWLKMLYSIAVLRIRIIQNSFYIDLIRERFDYGNELLQEIIVRSKTQINSRLIMTIDLCQQKENAVWQNYQDLLIVKDLYGKIWQVANLIDKSFGWSLLAMISENFLAFVSHGYWLFTGAQEVSYQGNITGVMCTLTPIAMLLTMLCYSNYCCRNSAGTTGHLIHKIEKRSNNETYNNLLRNFSLQVLHEPVQITANGFFEINLDLLGSIVAATVTYLVILIQFKLNEANTKYADNDLTN